MARPVLGIGVPHGPGLPRAVEQAKGASPTGHLFDQVRSRLEAAAPDLIVTVTSDHLVNFFMDNMPAFAVGVVDRADGPHESWRTMPWYEIQGDSGAGRSLVRYGLRSDFDVASCEEVRLDHSTLVPLHFLTPRMDVPVLPLFVKGLVRPLPRASRALAFGRMLRQFIEDIPDNRRVAVVASGSFSLEVGGPRVGWLDEPWVTEVTHQLNEGKSAALARRATEPRMAHAGNVAGELLNWFVLQGFVGATRPASLVREPNQGHAFGVWEDPAVSAYGVNKLLYQLEQDPARRERFRENAAEAFADFPLSAEETEALIEGDVATLFRQGAHPFLLMHLARHRLSGLDTRSYFERMKTLAPEEMMPSG